MFNSLFDWVYNAADIDGSKVVWAREMDPENDRNLLAYYKDRKVWLVEPDSNPPRISAYRYEQQAPIGSEIVAKVLAGRGTERNQSTEQ